MEVRALLDRRHEQGVSTEIQQNVDQVSQAIQDYLSVHRHELPEPAKGAIERYIGFYRRLAAKPVTADATKTQALVVALASLSSEVAGCLLSDQSSILLASELAFLHLNRTLHVDTTEQAKWAAAFKMGETEVEKFGALHLLRHGIYAFKAHASGARTDLMFQEKCQQSHFEKLPVSGLVLTEWKLFKGNGNARSAFQQAERQAKEYQATALAGVELRSTRFCIVVSKEQVQTPDDKYDGSVRYKFINIAINRLSPSALARKPH